MRQFGEWLIAHMQVHLFIKGVIVVVPYIPIMRIISLSRVSKRWPQEQSYDSQLRMFFTYFNGWKKSESSTSWHIKLYRLQISVSINKIPIVAQSFIYFNGCFPIMGQSWVVTKLTHMSPRRKVYYYYLVPYGENLLIPGLINNLFWIFSLLFKWPC